MSSCIYYSRFAVDERPFCVWEWDLPTRNREFVRNLDPEQFSFLASALYPALQDPEVGQRAAVAIRTTYGHALETFFAVLFAALQAPDCVPGWLAKYQLSDLRSLCRKVASGTTVLSRLPLEETTWRGVAAAVFSIDPKGEHAAIANNYGKLWGGFAHDFVDEGDSIEYNSVKHGLRLVPGGFTVKIGKQREKGVLPPESEMHTAGSSRYGASYLSPERIGESRRHFRVRRVSRNWIPENHFHAIQLLTTSMICVRSRVLLVSGVPREEGRFPVPDDDDYFKSPWRLTAGVSSINFDHSVEPQDIRELTAREILAVYQSQKEP